ncbi:MAG: phosphate ABC transporter, permease protein PstA, partial [Burkholderiaceae bacterium]
MSAVASSRTKPLRAMIRRHKRWDMLFGLLGLLAMMVGVMTLAALFTDMVVTGIPRLTGDFFTS